MMKRAVLSMGVAALLIGGSGQVAAESGKEIYEGGTAPTCASCHDRGIAGAPRIDEPDDWADRPTDVDELVTSTLEGLGAMPRYEGRADPDELIAAIEYMLSTLE